jgi:hypothetical protein
VSITLHDRMNASDRAVSVDCRTVKVYGYSDCGLNTSVDRSGTSISVGFGGVVAPWVCLTSSGPARADINLGAIADGDYALNLTFEGQSTDAKMAVTGDAITFASLGSRSILFPRRVPPGDDPGRGRIRVGRPGA